MGRKVFVSFLGASDYQLCEYQKEGIAFGGKLRFIQEASIYYLLNKDVWKETDVAFILLTAESKRRNWLDDGQTDKDGNIKKQQGLESRLSEMNLPFQIRTIQDLPVGNNEKEIWYIFDRVFDVIQEGDELYLDITHGYRYLPMLMLVLCNYSKFLKNTSVRSITYGNYEISQRGRCAGSIVDMMPLSFLQDWTYAAGQYLESGNVTGLEHRCKDFFAPILKESKGQDKEAAALKKFVKYLRAVVDERQTCRGMDIISSASFVTLKETADAIQVTSLSPLNPIIEKIRESFEPFDCQENIDNGFAAAKWCFDNGLIQQAVTILQEAVVSFFCERFDIRKNDEESRELINCAFNCAFWNTPESQWKIDGDEKIQKVKNVLETALAYNKELVNDFHNLTEVRNDLNHSGMRSKKTPLSAKSIRENIKKCLDEIPAILKHING